MASLPVPGTDSDQTGVAFLNIRVRHIRSEVGARRLHCINLLLVQAVRFSFFFGLSYVG